MASLEKQATGPGQSRRTAANASTGQSTALVAHRVHGPLPTRPAAGQCAIPARNAPLRDAFANTIADLEKAGIEYGPRGIKVDARLRTTKRRVFANGDVTVPQPLKMQALVCGQSSRKGRVVVSTGHPRSRKFLTATAILLAIALGGCADNPDAAPPGTIGWNKSTGGALLGAAAGGLVGNQFGDGAGQAVMTLAGTLLGGFFGHEVGKSLDRSDAEVAHRAAEPAFE